MNRIVMALVLVALCGCEPVAPTVPDADIKRASGEWSWSLGVSSAAPSPDVPAPDNPTGICRNCNGRGKIGDGTIMVTCPVCNGTGKSTTDEPVDAPGVAPFSVPAEPKGAGGDDPRSGDGAKQESSGGSSRPSAGFFRLRRR